MKTAVVLFNLGGPDRADCVRPFLFNLFNDPAIIRLPSILRTPLAYLIAKRRAKIAAEIYENIGGSSPIVPNTLAQASALEGALSDLNIRVFTAMRYWHPMAGEVALAVKEYDPDHIILLPLYPQYSTTTSASSLKDWKRAAHYAGLEKPTQEICCYPTESGFIDATAEMIRAQWNEASKHGAPRILFSAHGLPEKIVKDGDPYQWQCEQTAKAIINKLGFDAPDYVSCYQSKVGRLKWIGPSTEDEIKRAGKDSAPVIVVPMAFVSEHSETLVELDIEYKKLAENCGIPFYGRVPTVSAHSLFIDGLASLVRQTLNNKQKTCSQNIGRICPAQFSGCPQKASA